MNIERIIRVTSCYLFLTGYQIRWYDRKTLHYRLPIFGVLYFLILLILYLICFCHHFESSSVLKVLLDISPFLKHLVRFHVLLGLKVYVFCMIEYKNLAKIFNGLIRIFTETIQCRKSFDPKETVVYLLFFFTLMVALSFGLYIAIEMKFEIPPLDHIMIGVALLMPHLTLAGCLRLYTLGLWLIKREIATILTILKAQEEENDLSTTECITIVEIVNPVFNNNSSVATLYGFYEKIVKRVEVVTDYLKIFDKILQRQLSILVGMNFNCMLAGVYSHVYFKNTWNVLFTDRNRRIFYAANSAIFVCILVDYGVLLITLWSFNGAKYNLYNFINNRLFGEKALESETKTILKHIKHKLSKELNLNLFGLVEFNTWNFLLFQGLTISIIAIVVGHLYFNDQIKALNERLDIND